ncbi:MAG: hypothetical protein H7338_01145 [Candidatus Sericytochromatia bacterium]|nr:hypothetical protein [Candidatus Sericytochromatia bacterium]
MPDLPERRANVSQAYDGLARLLPGVQNVGDSWDEKDLYWVMEQATQISQAVHPEFLCRSGCTTCCRGDSIPIVSSIEWRRLYPHIYGLPEGMRRLIVRQAREIWGPILHMLLKGKAGYEDDGRLRIVPKELEATVHCPLLAYGKCSVYLARPFQCRSFGNFAQSKKGDMSLYMCSQASQHIEETFPADTALPVLNPYIMTLVALEGANPVVAMLPLWIAAHIEGPDFSQTCTLEPDFEAVVKRFQATPGTPSKH